VDDPFSREATPDAGAGPGAVGRYEESRIRSAETSARLCRCAHQHHEQIGKVLAALDQIMRPTADGVAEADQIASAAPPVGLGLRQHRVDDL
jgi:hypothetical protein